MKLPIVLPLILFLTGCNLMPEMDSLVEDRKVEYKKSRDAQKDLEVPPDLTRDRIDNALVVPDIGASGSATFSEYSSERHSGSRPTGTATGVLTKVEAIDLQRNGDKRWLVIKAPPAQVWSSLIAFWQENGVLLLEQDPEVGLMRTSWLENRADIKSDFITDAIRGVFDGLYSADTRDQFRVRLEEGPDNSTELYLTHRGMQEKIMAGSNNQGEQSVWVPRPTDHGLEAVMLRRIMIYLGVNEKRATAEVQKKGSQGAARSRSQLLRNSNEVALRIDEDLERSWRLTGVALDRVGFAVEDRDRNQGVYFVRYNDPYADQEKKEGLLSKLAFWSDDSQLNKTSQYQVRLSPRNPGTEVSVHSEQGQRDNSATAVRILTLLHEQIR
ncbi:MAG: outer membrane protein assembly factor BamC [Gammaproteobacteria bacterium SHHR-1]|uniref:outer membrane protein assembly factor BamC n=1 Tax=Magnetovirga frankeli TaxID=947516 RepID=UPI0012930AE4|nr:outer membrane protein assembly factor BamC [gamma proteobacterium SS-5]